MRPSGRPAAGPLRRFGTDEARRSTRRRLLAAVGAITLAYPLSSFAQQRAARIGFMSNIERERSGTYAHVIKRLAESGYVEGKNLVIEYRNGGGRAEHAADQVRELLRLNLDLIITMGPATPVRALMAEKATLPVVFLAIDYDPVDSGFVASYNRPGGNITGAYIAQPALAVKRFEIARELLPAAKCFLVMYDLFCRDQFAAAREAAKKAGIRIEAVEFKGPPYDYAAAFAQGRRAAARGLIGMMSPQFFYDRSRIAALAVQNGVPAIGGANPFAEAGFLASYGSPFEKVAERGAELAARILKGAKPADLPVEQVNVFEFAVNMKTARSLGIKIPQSLLVRADKVFG